MNWFIGLITFGWADAITLAPLPIYIKEKYFMDEKIRNHESIHWWQQLEVYLMVIILTSIIQVILLLNGIFEWWILLILICPPLFYYVWYLIEFLIKLPINGRKTYVNISFEREAYSNERDNFYIKRRKHFAWIKYLI